MFRGWEGVGGRIGERLGREGMLECVKGLLRCISIGFDSLY